MLRRLLEHDQIAFSDLVRAVHKPGFSLTRSFFSGAQVERGKIEQLNEDLRAHVEQRQA